VELFTDLMKSRWARTSNLKETTHISSNAA